MGEHLIDWVNGGSIYSLNGEVKYGQRSYDYKFNSAIQSDDGTYAVIYEKLGTKALLLKHGEILRELNRSFYKASAYEYPIAFLKLPDGEYALIHCPSEYCLIEIEYVESGIKITQMDRNPDDCFHSRFRVSPSNSMLLNTGWVWHPYDIIALYNIQDGIKDNLIFDRPKAHFPIHAEACSAEFLSDDLLVVSSNPDDPLSEEELSDTLNLYPGQIGLFSITQHRFLKKVTIDFKPGTLIPINEDLILDLYEHPKLVDLNSGEIKQRFEDINSGEQSSSIIHHIPPVPPVAVSQDRKSIAFGQGEKIELLEFS